MDNDKKINQEQKICLIDRKVLSVSGVEKMISVQPNLLQISTIQGIIQIVGANMEVNKLDLEQHILEVSGMINSIKYLENNTKKTPLFKRIFK